MVTKDFGSGGADPPPWVADFSNCKLNGKQMQPLCIWEQPGTCVTNCSKQSESVRVEGSNAPHLPPNCPTNDECGKITNQDECEGTNQNWINTQGVKVWSESAKKGQTGSIYESCLNIKYGEVGVYPPRICDQRSARKWTSSSQAGLPW